METEYFHVSDSKISIEANWFYMRTKFKLQWQQQKNDLQFSQQNSMTAFTIMLRQNAKWLIF